MLRFAGLVLISNQIAVAQEQPKVAAPPDATATQASGNTSAVQPQSFQSNAPGGVIARRSIFFPELATNTTPLDVRQKFELFAEKSVSPYAVLSATVSAASEQAFNTYAGYGQGWDGYGKRFGAAMATNTSNNFFGTFVISSIFHEDPRHFVLADQSNAARIKYALTRQVIGRTDSGHRTINLAKIFGPLAAEALANTYLPENERTVDKTFERYGERMAFGVVDTLIKEYWVTIFRSMRSSKTRGSEP
jgi:hypothetical protein